MTEAEEQLQHQIIKSLNDALVQQDSFELFKEKLAAYINELINHDFSKLISILYRADVSEAKLKSLLKTSPGVDAGFLICELMIERELKKIESRKNYSKK